MKRCVPLHRGAYEPATLAKLTLDTSATYERKAGADPALVCDGAGSRLRPTGFDRGDWVACLLAAAFIGFALAVQL